MSRWVQLRHADRWAYHVITAPLIGLLGTYLWANLLGEGKWLFWQDMNAIQAVDFYGFLLYPALAAIYEIGLLVRRSGYSAGHAAGFAEHQSAAIKSGQDEGKNIALNVAWRLASTEEQKNLLRVAASDLDINLPAVLGQLYGTATVTVRSPWDSLWRRLADASADLRRVVSTDTFDTELDHMLRVAAGAALSDLTKQIERRREVENRRLQESESSNH